MIRANIGTLFAVKIVETDKNKKIGGLYYGIH